MVRRVKVTREMQLVGGDEVAALRDSCDEYSLAEAVYIAMEREKLRRAHCVCHAAPVAPYGEPVSESLSSASQKTSSLKSAAKSELRGLPLQRKL